MYGDCKKQQRNTLVILAATGGGGELIARLITRSDEVRYGPGSLKRMARRTGNRLLLSIRPNTLSVSFLVFCL